MICARCGRDMPRFEASAYEGAEQIFLCHPNDRTLPDCYREWSWATTFGPGTFPLWPA